MSWITGLAFVFFAPFVGGLIAGFDRKITARLQGRIGPPILQPFYDVGKLLQKDNLVVRRSQHLYTEFFFVLTIFTGALFFAGGDLLLVIFSLAMAGVFFALGGYKASSPYSFIGAQREVLQMVSYEPAVLLAAVGMYMVTGSFKVSVIAAYPKPLVMLLPGIFFAFFFILPVKFRKSPFDLSTSHHAHQEIVKGITTEISGKTLALVEIAHWYEYVFVLGMGYLFFASNIWLGLVMTFVIFELLLVVDNSTARVRWQAMMASSWIVALVAGGLNILYLMLRH
ncbi:MAG: NADH-quinone oxidoreductase subunit H [Candidatus Omnitrophica bacterium]|nr:NADH-quinone oxidoreductase subunit H [Candidatus Omnitrophota bacterium]